MQFGFVPPGALPPVWSRTVDLLDKAVSAGGYDWCEVSEDLLSGRAQLWLTLDPVPVAAMVTRRDGDTLEVWLAGGAVLRTSVPFLETAIRAAQDDGATNGRIIGRKGWQRVLRSYGWRPEGDTLVKDFAA
jgi:hypothetical protein